MTPPDRPKSELLVPLAVSGWTVSGPIWTKLHLGYGFLAVALVTGMIAFVCVVMRSSICWTSML